MLPALDEIDALRGETEAAATQILDAAAVGLQLLATDPTPAVVDRVREALRAITAACAFEDLAGQRLSRLRALLEGSLEADPLLNGPALPGSGLDQAAADALFAEPVEAD